MPRIRVPLAPARIRWAAVLAAAVVILVASVLPPAGVEDPMGPFGLLGLDKYVHALAYAGFAGIVAYALVDGPIERALLVAFATAVLFGLGVELVQMPIPYRTGGAADFVANAVGATLAVSGWWGTRGYVRFQSGDYGSSGGTTQPR